MGIFGAIDTSGSGVTVARKWLDAISDNISNINTVRRTSQPAFQERFVQAQAVDYSNDGTGSGVVVTGVRYGSSTGILRYDPQNPLADANGMVRAPDIDLGAQMSQMIMAQRSYEANLAVVDRAKEAYQQAITIGK